MAGEIPLVAMIVIAIALVLISFHIGLPNPMLVVGTLAGFVLGQILLYSFPVPDIVGAFGWEFPLGIYWEFTAGYLGGVVAGLSGGVG